MSSKPLDSGEHKALTERFTVVEVDVDVKPSADWLELWTETRMNILEYCGYDTVKVRQHPTRNGWHFWFHIDKAVDYDELIRLQFLLGDDHGRVWASMQRRGFSKFRGLFNVLFGKKYKVKRKRKGGFRLVETVCSEEVK